MKKILFSFFCSLIMLTSVAYADVFVIDVRTADEFSQGHVENALNIEHTKILEGIALNKVNKNDTIYVYCRSGKRAEFAKTILESQGFSKVTNLGGLEQAQAFFSNKK